MELGLEGVVEGDLVWDAGRKGAYVGEGEEILCCKERDVLRGGSDEVKGGLLVYQFRAWSLS